MRHAAARAGPAVIIEGAMILALGALSASLLWLVALPILSRRAVRLATARLAQRMPLTMAEVGAERDGLRAVHAVEVRRLEQAGEATAARAAALMSENGRHVARIATLETLERRLRADVERLEQDLGAANRTALEAQATLGTQALILHEALGLSERRGDLLADAERRLADEQAMANERRATIAGLETRTTGQDLALQDAFAHITRLSDELATAKAAWIEAASERDVARADGHLAAAQRGALQASVDALTADAARLRGELDDAARATAGAEKRYHLQAQTIGGLADRIMEQDTELATLRRLLQESQSRHDAAQGEGNRLPAEQGPDAGDPTDRAARLRAAVAALGADLVAFAAPDSEAAASGKGEAADDAGAAVSAVADRSNVA